MSDVGNRNWRSADAYMREKAAISRRCGKIRGSSHRWTHRAAVAVPEQCGAEQKGCAGDFEILAAHSLTGSARELDSPLYSFLVPGMDRKEGDGSDLAQSLNDARCPGTAAWVIPGIARPLQPVFVGFAFFVPGIGARDDSGPVSVCERARARRIRDRATSDSPRRAARHQDKASRHRALCMRFDQGRSVDARVIAADRSLA